MFTVYVLSSIKFKKYYIGHTKDFDKRIARHNSGLVKSTKAYRPWKLVYSEQHLTKNDAYRRELEIKLYKGGNAFKKLIGI